MTLGCQTGFCGTEFRILVNYVATCAFIKFPRKLYNWFSCKSSCDMLYGCCGVLSGTQLLEWVKYFPAIAVGPPTCQSTVISSPNIYGLQYDWFNSFDCIDSCSYRGILCARSDNNHNVLNNSRAIVDPVVRLDILNNASVPCINDPTHSAYIRKAKHSKPI